MEKLKLAVCQGAIMGTCLALAIEIVIWSTWGAMEFSRWILSN